MFISPEISDVQNSKILSICMALSCGMRMESKSTRRNQTATNNIPLLIGINFRLPELCNILPSIIFRLPTMLNARHPLPQVALRVYTLLMSELYEISVGSVMMSASLMPMPRNIRGHRREAAAESPAHRATALQRRGVARSRKISQPLQGAGVRGWPPLRSSESPFVAVACIETAAHRR